MPVATPPKIQLHDITKKPRLNASPRPNKCLSKITDEQLKRVAKEVRRTRLARERALRPGVHASTPTQPPKCLSVRI